MSDGGRIVGGELSILTFNISKEEEAELELCVVQGLEWSELPSDAKRCLGYSANTWAQFVIKHSIQHQLFWKSTLVSKMLPDERSYFDALIRYSQDNLMVYPYHLQGILCKSFRLTPFKYYLTMMYNVMKSERSYDCLPNFTATDGVRLLGVGRNQFIDTMNAVRAKSWLWRKRRGALYELLPKEPPTDVPLSRWWDVRVAFITEDDVRSSSKREHHAIDLIIARGVVKAGELHRATVQALYRRGLVYIDVPIRDDDLIIVPPLRGFVMNRVLGDYFEKLLYKIFVAIDERTTIKQLASVLQIDIADVKQAVSLYIRLGFAEKKHADAHPSSSSSSSMMVDHKAMTSWHPSWGTTTTTTTTAAAEKEAPDTTTPASSTSSSTSSSASSSTSSSTSSSMHSKRIGFIFDSSITAYLMMGNLAPGLKMHAVTMFEVGKLPEESLDDFMLELGQVNPIGEGEAQTYIDHAVCLRRTIEFLRGNERCLGHVHGAVDLLRCERMNSLDEPTRLRVLDKNYEVLVSMAPLTSSSLSGTRIIPRHFGPALPVVSFVWYALYTYDMMRCGAPSVLYPRGTRVRRLPPLLHGYTKVRFSSWDTESTIVSVANLLPTLNETLLSSPVYIQAFAYGEEPMQVQVPFPIDLMEHSDGDVDVDVEHSDGDGGVEHSDGDGGVGAQSSTTPYAEHISLDKMQYHPAVQRLARNVKLLQHSFGYITMINPHVHMPSRKSTWAYGCPPTPSSTSDGALPSSQTTYPTSQWAPLQIHFGMPLFSPELNECVCNSIAKHALFSPENLAEHHTQSRLMCNDVFDFIERMQCAEHKIDVFDAVSPYPTEVVVFPGRGRVCTASMDSDVV